MELICPHNMVRSFCKSCDPINYVANTFNKLISELKTETDLDHKWLNKIYLHQEGLCYCCKTELVVESGMTNFQQVMIKGHLRGHSILICLKCHISKTVFEYTPLKPKSMIRSNTQDLKNEYNQLVTKFNQLVDDGKTQEILVSKLSYRVVELESMGFEIKKLDNERGFLNTVLASLEKQVSETRTSLVNLTSQKNKVEDQLAEVSSRLDKVNTLLEEAKSEHNLLVKACSNFDVNKEEAKHYEVLKDKCIKLKSILSKYSIQLTKEELEVLENGSLTSSVMSWFY